jgi:hypothetical protein
VNYYAQKANTTDFVQTLALRTKELMNLRVCFVSLQARIPLHMTLCTM